MLLEWIRGGTFTDVTVMSPRGELFMDKAPTNVTDLKIIPAILSTLYLTRVVARYPRFRGPMPKYLEVASLTPSSVLGISSSAQGFK